MNFCLLPTRHAKKTAIIDEATGIHFTYKMLRNEVSKFKECVNHTSNKSLGFVLCQNNIGSLIAYLAAIQYKDAVLLLDAHINTSALNNLIELYEPDWILAPNDCPLNNIFYERSQDFYQCGLYFLSVREKANHPRIYPELALLLPTSGSTGNPKIVRLSYQNLRTNTKSIIKFLGIQSSDRTITTLPFNHIYGLSVVNSYLLSGATILLTNQSIAKKAFWDFAKEHEITSISGVPYTYQILKQIRFNQFNISSLRTLTHSGGKLPEELTDYLNLICLENNWQFFSMYGQTEASGRMSYLPPSYFGVKKGAIGKPVPGSTFFLDPEDQEIVFLSNSVMLGYAENRYDLSKGNEMSGVLRTGDIGYQDEDGYFYISNRKKRFTKIFGNRINLDDMENMLSQELGTEAICLADDQTVTVFISEPQKENMVKTILSKNLRVHPSGISVLVINHWPRTGLGKIDYTNLRNKVTQI